MKVCTLFIALGAAGLIGCDKDSTTTATPAETRTDRDNSAVNTRDRDSAAKTAGQQSQAKTDIDIVAEIRRKVVDTKMSINAQNCKIVVDAGKVTLRGPVQSQDEKDTVGRLAAEVVTAANVDNQLEIETNK